MKAAVASGHRDVTFAACEILRAGGNAFDAAAAAGFASVVAEPPLNSLGGGGFLLAKPFAGKAVLYDFFVDSPGRELQNQNLVPHFIPVTVHFPSSDQIFNVGHGSVAVPGILRGLCQTQKELGRLPLREILAPAVQLAREGVPLNRAQAHVLKLLLPIMVLTQGARDIFSPGGNFLEQGDRYLNPELAAFLETLAETGDREFYEGEIARKITDDMREHDGLLTMRDLASYRVLKKKPLTTNYRKYQFITNPPPSFGGPLLANAFKLLQESLGTAPAFGTASHLGGLITLLRVVEKYRNSQAFFAPQTAQNGFAKSVAETRKAFGGTTHISIIDREGNAAGLSCSNGEGSGYVVPGTGIMLNNMMGEDDLHPEGFHASEPGLRIASMMSPSFLLRGNQVQLVLGSGGSKRIAAAILQVLSNIVDHKMQLPDAIEAPRLYWDGEMAQIEPGFDAAVLAALAQKWPVNPWQVKDVYFGGVHAASADGQAAGDSRRDGAAAAL